MMQRKRIQLLLALVLILILSPLIAAQKRAEKDNKARVESQSAVVWHDPGDVSTLNLFYGAGGKSTPRTPTASSLS